MGLNIPLLNSCCCLSIRTGALIIAGLQLENSGFVAAYLLVELTRLIELIWSLVLNSFMYFHFGYFIEELLVIGFELICAWIGYSYYSTMPKTNKYIF
nr:uncharacterized protein LOC106681062 isoform X2 [Halyomorpha halys]